MLGVELRDPIHDARVGLRGVAREILHVIRADLSRFIGRDLRRDLSVVKHRAQ